MAQNYKCSGKIFPYVVAGADVASGQLVLLGAIVGVALGAGAVGDTIQVAVEGVFQVPKAADAITIGAKLYYDATNHNLTTTATSNTLAGYAYQPQASGDANCLVKLIF